MVAVLGILLALGLLGIGRLIRGLPLLPALRSRPVAPHVEPALGEATSAPSSSAPLSESSWCW